MHSFHAYKKRSAFRGALILSAKSQRKPQKSFAKISYFCNLRLSQIIPFSLAQHSVTYQDDTLNGYCSITQYRAMIKSIYSLYREENVRCGQNRK